MIRDTGKTLSRIAPGKVAEALGAEYRGQVRAGRGSFAASRLAVFAQENPTRWLTTSDVGPALSERDARCASSGR